MYRLPFFIALFLLLVFASCTNQRSISKCPDFRNDKSKLPNKTWASKKKSQKKRQFAKQKAAAKAAQDNPAHKLTSRKGQVRSKHLKRLVNINRGVISKQLERRQVNMAEQKIAEEAFQEFSSTSKQSEDCDILHTYDKQKIRCVVKEITPGDVKYVPCSDPDAAVISISRSKVRLIAYADGRMKIVDQGSRTSTNESDAENGSYEGGPKTHPFAIVSLVAGILGLVFIGFSVLALIFGIIALSRIRENEKMYKGKGMAITGIVLAGLFVLILLLVLAVIGSFAFALGR